MWGGGAASSRLAFLRALAVPAGRRWLDVGCGTGALTGAVSAHADPAGIVGVDPVGRLPAPGPRGRRPARRLVAADARALPLPDRRFDAVVSGLALNFVPEPGAAVAELARVAVPGATVAAYVWDYAGGMAMLRYFWDAAAALDPAVARWDEAEPVRDVPAGTAAGTVDRRGTGRRDGRARSRYPRSSPTSTTTGTRSSAGRGRRPGTWPRWAAPPVRTSANCCASGCRPPRTEPSRSPPGPGPCAACADRLRNRRDVRDNLGQQGAKLSLASVTVEAKPYTVRYAS